MELDLNNKKTSEFAVLKLFECWKNKKWKKVDKYLQKSWLKNSRDKEFKKMFSSFEVVDFNIMDKEIITDCREEVDFRVDMIFRNKQISRYGKANTIREEAPYKPSIKGEWGVNPISLLRWQK